MGVQTHVENHGWVDPHFLKVEASEEGFGTLKYEKDIDLTGATLDPKLTTSDKLDGKIANTWFKHEWKISWDGGTQYRTITNSPPNQILVIWDEKPEWIDITNYGRRANVRTYRRLNWLCALANGQGTLAGVGDAIGPATVSFAYFNGVDSVLANKDEGKLPTLASTWLLLDGRKGDCATIAALMKCCLDQLGAIGSEVRYVFPCHQSWAKLEKGSFDYHNREQRPGPNGAYLAVRIFSENRWSWSKWEGCCKFSDKYWMGSYDTFQPTAKDVLVKTLAFPNIVPSRTHQAYEDSPGTVVPFPTK